LFFCQKGRWTFTYKSTLSLHIHRLKALWCYDQWYIIVVCKILKLACASSSSQMAIAISFCRCLLFHVLCAFWHMFPTLSPQHAVQSKNQHESSKNTDQTNHSININRGFGIKKTNFLTFLDYWLYSTTKNNTCQSLLCMCIKT